MSKVTIVLLTHLILAPFIPMQLLQHELVSSAMLKKFNTIVKNAKKISFWISTNKRVYSTEMQSH